MQKAELQQVKMQDQSAAQQRGSVVVETPPTEQITQLEAMIAASPHQAALQKMADGMHNSPHQRVAQNFSEAINNSPLMVAQRMRHEQMFGVAQRLEDEEPLQGKFAATVPVQLEQGVEARPNNTGLPDNLKSGIENLSGMSMDSVKVHYNSAQPAQLNALAYAQGSDIHVAPGQEQHLPHEAWHVVQQAQGRVKPTMQMKEGVPVNDDKGLEREADVMGKKALQMQRHVDMAPRVVHKAGGTLQQQSDDGALIQRVLATNSYVSSLRHDYLKVLNQIDPKEVVRVITGNVNRIISTKGEEYEHMRRAPVPLTTEPVIDSVYHLRDAPTRTINQYEIESVLSKEPELTWAMETTNEQFELALDVIAFLKRVPDETTRTDVKGLLAKVGGNSGHINAITTFLDRLAGPAALKEATTILAAVQCDVPKTEAAINFLDMQKPPERTLARRELEQAGFDVVNATVRMSELAPLLSTATTTAATRAEERHATSVEAAKITKDQAIEVYRQAHEKELPKPLSKTQEKKGKRPKLSPKQTSAVKGFDLFKQQEIATEKQAVDQADIDQPVNEANYLTEEIGFVSEISAGAQTRETVTQLALLVDQDKGKIRALQALMLGQSNIDDLTLARSIVTSGLDVLKLTATCLPLLPTLGSLALVFATGALIVETDSAAVKQWVQTTPATVKEDIVSDLRNKPKFIIPLLAAYQTLGGTNLFFDICTYIEKKNITQANRLTWLFGQYGLLTNTDFLSLLQHASNDNQSLTELESIFTANSNPARLNMLSVKELLALVGTGTAQRVLDAYAIVPPTDPVEVVQMVLKYTDAKTAQGSAPLMELLRIKGEIAHNAANAQAMITVLKQDTTYAHGLLFGDAGYGEDRTGFIQFTFRDGSVSDIHTHWNVHAKNIVSMHVQAGGGNGVEINQWGNWFGDVRDLVTLRQNNAPGGMQPSIAPLINTLATGHYPDRHIWTRANGTLS